MVNSSWNHHLGNPEQRKRWELQLLCSFLSKDNEYKIKHNSPHQCLINAALLSGSILLPLKFLFCRALRCYVAVP